MFSTATVNARTAEGTLGTATSNTKVVTGTFGLTADTKAEAGTL
jgi:hypothetical protein